MIEVTIRLRRRDCDGSPDAALVRSEPKGWPIRRALVDAVVHFEEDIQAESGSTGAIEVRDWVFQVDQRISLDPQMPWGAYVCVQDKVRVELARWDSTSCYTKPLFNLKAEDETDIVSQSLPKELFPPCVWQDDVAIVGFDLGTSRTSLWYTMKNSTPKHMEIAINGREEKVETAMFVELHDTSLMEIDSPEQCRVVTVGHSAFRDYMDAAERSDGALFISNFKMLLYWERERLQTPVQPGADPWIPIRGTRYRMRLGLMFTLFLQAMAEQAKRYLAQRGIQAWGWVLTVPAIWSDASKMFMRRCAVKAGLIDSVASRYLTLCIEPEAALFCANMIDPGSQVHEISRTPGARLVVLDCGGGTIDLSCMKVIQADPIQFSIECVADGCASGGSAVDGCFLGFCRDLVGHDTFDAWGGPKREELMHAWIQAKEKELDFEAPAMLDISDIDIMDALEEAVQKSAESRCFVSRGRFVIPSDVYAMFFENSICQIVDKLASFLRTTGRVEMVVMAGGYSKCVRLQERVRSYITKRTMLLYVLNQPSIAIVRGAVIYGRSYARGDALVKQRIAPCSYGVCMISSVPVPGATVADIYVHNKRAHHRVVSFHVLKGSVVGTNEARHRVCYRRSSEGRSGVMLLVASNEAPARAVTGRSAAKCFEALRVNLKEFNVAEADEITVSLVYGGAEILLALQGTT